MLTLVMALSDAEIVELLTVATTDVFWVSESEAPFEVLHWSELSRDTFDAAVLRQQVAVAADVAIGTCEAAKFFQAAIEPQDWHGDIEQQAIEQYQHIIFLLQQHLTQVQVYCVGECEMDVYIVGKTPADNWVALKTMSVET
ncbi:nuclease A inhibitor family protein [filamentous cyanobacterium LEGE 11480]|uniref:Nuclease A inhibitor family protein n=1 Tax=Romeriopsis navalis LEGE 11480 TaxID=2777977 RepID=A0A928Z3C7_9CYAN|nr:nuclease A inhibitor family protein [Romeriopsis navalis]MBE9030529.1 nuclease A inhibitor family protein [Romeriopsis navalis LEGE 11480]